jgi:hypothetical protein
MIAQEEKVSKKFDELIAKMAIESEKHEPLTEEYTLIMSKRNRLIDLKKWVLERIKKRG